MGARFVFRLETVLRVRQTREREALRRVAAQNRAIAALDALDEQAQAQIAQSQQDLRTSQEGGRFDPQVLSRVRGWIGVLRRQVHDRGLQRIALTQELRRLQQELRDARTQTRSLEQLRQRRLDQHLRAASRAEQALTDEAAQTLLMHRRRSAPEAAGAE